MNANIKKIIQYSLASLINAIISFGSTMILTRLLSKSGFGMINFYVSASNVVMGIICLGLDSAYIRFFYHPPQNNDHRQLAAHCLMVPNVLSVILIGLGFVKAISGPVASALGFDSWRLILLLLLNAYVLSILRFLNINYRMQEKTLIFVVQSIIITFATKMGYVLIAIVDRKTVDILAAGTFLCAAVAMIFFIVQRKDFVSYKNYSNRYYGKVYKYALFDAPLYNLIYLNAYIPQLLIKRGPGEEVLGIYGGLQVFVYAVQVISSGFATFWAPYVYKNYKEKNKEIMDVYEVVMFLSVIMLTMILLMGNILFLFLGRNFREEKNLLGMFLIAPIVNILLETTSYGIALERKNYISLIFHFLSFGLNVVLGIILLPEYGLAGIAAASMVSALIMLIGQSMAGQKYYRTIRSYFRFYTQIIISVGIALLYFFYYEEKMITVPASLAAILLTLLLNKDMLAGILRKRRDKC